MKDIKMTLEEYIFEKSGKDPKGLTTFAVLEQAVKILDQKKADLGKEC